MAYDTNNPIGSTDPRDLYDNAGIFDKFSNGEQPFYPNRFGQQGLSLSGMRQDFQNSQDGREEEFQQFLASSGFSWLGDYAAGLTFTNRSQYFTRDNLSYRLAPGASLPYLTTGNWALEQSNFVLFPNEDVLRQDLGSPSGSGLVGHKADGLEVSSRSVREKLNDVVARADYTSDTAYNAAKSGKVNIDGSGKLDATIQPDDGSAPVTISRFFREESTNGPRDMLVWASPQSVALSGKEWAMGGFRVFGKYIKSRGPVFKSASYQHELKIPSDLAHGMSSVKSENWYASFAVANDGDDAPSFKLSPFLFVKSVAGNVCTLGKCGEVLNVSTIDNATYSWAANGLAGTDVLVLNEVFLSGVPTWSMRIAKITANTAGTITVDNAGSIGPKCFLLPAPAGWDHYRYCASFYFDTAEVRNIFDCGGGPTRCRMSGTNVVYAHGNDGTYSTYLDGTIPPPGKKIDFSRFIAPLATGIYLQSSYQMATSSFPLRAEILFDMDGSIHAPEAHTFKKESADMVSAPLTVFLAFRGGQYCMPSTGGANSSQIVRVDFSVTGWFEA